jgi:hypothetical protein
MFPVGARECCRRGPRTLPGVACQHIKPRPRQRRRTAAPTFVALHAQATPRSLAAVAGGPAGLLGCLADRHAEDACPPRAKNEGQTRHHPGVTANPFRPLRVPCHARGPSGPVGRANSSGSGSARRTLPTICLKAAAMVVPVCSQTARNERKGLREACESKRRYQSSAGSSAGSRFNEGESTREGGLVPLSLSLSRCPSRPA